MKNMFKIFKSSGSKGTSLALVVLLTGMIAALSTPVFAETGGGPCPAGFHFHAGFGCEPDH